MQPQPVGEWTTGLSDCFFDGGNCIITLFCPCITLGQIASIVDQGKTSCYANGKHYALLCFICGCCCYSCYWRFKLRHMYKLPPSSCGPSPCGPGPCSEPQTVWFISVASHVLYVKSIVSSRIVDIRWPLDGIRRT